MLGANLLVLALVAGLLYTGVKALSHYKGAKDTSQPVIKAAVTPVGMLATIDSSKRLSSLTVFVLRPGSLTGGSIVSVPVAADTVAGINGQRVPFTEVWQTGGPDALVAAAESTLGITVDQSLVADPSQLAVLLKPVSPIGVDLPTEVQTTDKSQTVSLFPRGEVSMSAAEAVQALNARTDQQSQRSRVPVVDAVWAGVATSVGKGRTEVKASTTPTSLPDLMNRLFAGPVASRGLPANRLPTGQSQGKDVDELDRPEAVTVFAIVAPSAMSAPASGLVYRIVAPPGYVSQVKYAVKLLLYLNANVQSISLDGPKQAQTVMMFATPSIEKDALNAQHIFGDAVSQPPKELYAGVDVVLQLGTSFLDKANPNGTLPSTTSTTSP
jgi:hypothetical protein